MNYTQISKTMSRRDFLKLGGAALAALMLPNMPVHAAPEDYEEFFEAPASLGRVAAWSQVVRRAPSPTAERVGLLARNEVIPLHASVWGEAPWPSNPVWYKTKGGFVHSGYVQPVENNPSSEVMKYVPKPGAWGQICVPVAKARAAIDSEYVAWNLYYGTVYRFIKAVRDEDGTWWYQLQEGLSQTPSLYIPASSIRYIPPEELAPISPGCSDKWIHISIEDQLLTCYEGEQAVFKHRIASGLWGEMSTPHGEFRILYKRHTRRMKGEFAGDEYDLPGVPFTNYFTWSGVAIHGTYWHNDYGRRHSHGCVNLPPESAKWVFRWTEPRINYHEYTREAEPEEGTLVVVT